uniref:Hypoxia-inducible factor 1-alpha inhibitor n=2 Tax=Hirondellea gigas TaxID=1518452 RepID=A0A2P2I6F5_9CRUS
MADIDYETKYFFPVKPIPRLSCRDPEALRLISSEKPVVLTDAKLCDSALKWNLDYLAQHIGPAKHVVFASQCDEFKYYDETKISQYCPNFKRPTQRLEITFQEFANKLTQWNPGQEKLYLQQGLNSSVGTVIAADFVSFNWPWLNAQTKTQGWGTLTSNLLLVAMAGNVTPVHYDEQQNLFCQLVGHKRCILFSPDHHDRLYPHPVYHPHDRQSQADIFKPDFDKFPGLRQISAQSAVLGPGDVLYIPIYWWHHISSLHNHPYTVSINFWYKGASTDMVIYPLLDRQKVAIMRNIEKMIMDALKKPTEVDQFFQSLILGRYTVPDVLLPSQLSTTITSRSSHLLPSSDKSGSTQLSSAGSSTSIIPQHDCISCRKTSSDIEVKSSIISKVKNDAGDGVSSLNSAVFTARHAVDNACEGITSAAISYNSAKNDSENSSDGCSCCSSCCSSCSICIQPEANTSSHQATNTFNASSSSLNQVTILSVNNSCGQQTINNCLNCSSLDRLSKSRKKKHKEDKIRRGDEQCSCGFRPSLERCCDESFTPTIERQPCKTLASVADDHSQYHCSSVSRSVSNGTCNDCSSQQHCVGVTNSIPDNSPIDHIHTKT